MIVWCPLQADNPSVRFFFFHFSPSLTWRDVQYLIVHTSNPLLNESDGLIFNGAGLAVSELFGFGVMDAEALVTRARHWIIVPPQLEQNIIPMKNFG